MLLPKLGRFGLNSPERFAAFKFLKCLKIRETLSMVKNKNITPDRDITANIGYKISILITYLVKTKLAFVPPNPNELLITEFISCSSIV